jgi:hypothetical protein
VPGEEIERAHGLGAGRGPVGFVGAIGEAVESQGVAGADEEPERGVAKGLAQGGPAHEDIVGPEAAIGGVPRPPDADSLHDREVKHLAGHTPEGFLVEVRLT